MNFLLKNTVYTRLRTIGIIFISILVPLVFHGSNIWSDDVFEWKIYGNAVLTTFLFTFFIWIGCEIIVTLLDKKITWKEHTTKRLILQTLIIILYTSVVVYFGVYYICFYHETAFDFNIYFQNFIFSVIITIFVNTIIAGIYFFREWKSSLLENEELKKNQILSEFEVLRNQVNPHFLFNCLNTLTAIIDENPKKANEFVVKLAEVYRYTLSHREQVLVDLKSELDFLQAYIYLNHMRFGDYLKIEINIDEAVIHSKSIVGLGLQMLLENAIKHNIISKNKPLWIQVFDYQDKIVVKNKLQLKTNVESTGIGLQNIKNRYHAVNHELEMEIYQTEEFFEVRLPLIQI